MNKNYDVAIIGSGPAGIMSAIKLQNQNLKVILLDDCAKLGGQIYKNVEDNQCKESTRILGKDYNKGLKLIKQLDLNKINYVNKASIWSIDKHYNIYFSKNNKAQTINAKKIIIATGSMERPFAVNGWTKPGVLSATSAQIMLKESSIIKNNAVFVGSGPLFYYVISQYLNAGAKIKAIIDTTPKLNYLHSLKYLPKALKKTAQLIQGIGFLLTAKKHKIKTFYFAKNIKFKGDDYLQEICFNDKDSIRANVAFIHHGLVPNINLQLQVGCEYEYSHKSKSIDIKVDSFMRSSRENIFVLGDGQSIKGAEVALIEAKIATLSILHDFNKIDLDYKKSQYKIYKNKLKDALCIRDFLNRLYLPAREMLCPNDDKIIVCRCEEITLGDVKASIHIDAKGMNTIKSFSRCGMGNCQGRFCGLTLMEVIARQTKRPIEELAYFNIRSPIKPVRIAEMLNLTK